MELCIDEEYLIEIAIYDLINTYIKNILISKFKIPNVKHSLPYAIMKYVAENQIIYNTPTYADEIYKKVKRKITVKNKRKSFYAILRKLQAHKLITIEKEENLLILRLDNTVANTIFNLINNMQNSNSQFFGSLNYILNKKDTKPSKFKELARSYASDKNYLQPEDKLKIRAYFEAYMELINNLVLCFVKKEYVDIQEEYKKIIYSKKNKKTVKTIYKTKRTIYIKETPRKEGLLFLPYQTRFNSKKKLYENVNKIKQIMKNAHDIFNYKYAVFLTLTTDVKKFNSILESAKAISYNFNRFMSYLTKYLGFRPPYLCVLEFHNNGNAHLHIIFFGVKYLLNGKKISYLWEKYGQGKIVKLYAIRYDGEKWTWTRGKPEDCKEDNLANYLTKYLIKAFYNNSELALYWLTNKRFFTYSRKLLNTTKKIPKGLWVYFNTFKEDILTDLEDFIEKTFIPAVYRYLKKFNPPPPDLWGDTIYTENRGYIKKAKWSWI